MHIIHSIQRPGPEIVRGLEQQSSATVHEAMGRIGAMHSSIKPIYSGMRLCGPAVTVKCHLGDNLMLQKARDRAKPGDVLAVDSSQFTEAGYWGEIMTWQAKVRSLGGLVTNGGVRDTLQIKAIGFPVFSGAVSIKGTVKETLGTINLAISCGGVLVNPGDIILGVEDGVVVIPLQEAEAALKKSRERAAKEERIIERVKAGESLFDILGFRDVLQRKGCLEEEEK
jgi:4-hydroxy-4-methyl-2-oxoglutarate aldolase